MRPARLAVLLLACKREPGTPSPREQVPTASHADDLRPGGASAAGHGAVATADLDLLHAIPTKLAVSSVVANPRISPFDLVDGDLATAWNSKTGQLVGAWIAFRVPPSTRVKEVKLTAGFASKGNEGDYFVLNPRIRRVAIWHDGIRLREHDLDITTRELQAVPVDATGGDFKVEVVAIQPGQRKSWREICISELQVIGTPPPGMRIDRSMEPDISVGSLDAAPLEPPGVELVEPPAFASIEAFCGDFIKRKAAPCPPWDHKCEKQPEANTCGGEPSPVPTLPALPAKWTGRWLSTHYGNAKEEVCNLALTVNGRTYVLEEVGGHDCGQPARLGGTPPYGRSRHELRVAELLGNGGEPELLVVATAPDNPKRSSDLDGGADLVEKLFLCAPEGSGAPRCASVTLGKLDFKSASGGGPGADGYEEWHEQRWRRDFTVHDGVLELSLPKGKPESFELDVPAGKHRLRVAP